MLRLFERGTREERWILDDLRAAGWEVTRGPGKGRSQWRCRFLGGHLAGSCDGIARGIEEAPKTWHLLEIKTANDRRFKELQRDGVQKSNPDHYAQMQLYMLGLDLERALYICVDKNDDHIYTERVKFDCAYAEALVNKAELVVNSPVPLTKIAEDPTWFLCKGCEHRTICHEGAVGELERNCRTCAASTPMPDGKWHCGFHRKNLSLTAQRAGCGDHVFIPALLPWEAVEGSSGGETQWVLYRQVDGTEILDSKGKLVPCATP